MEFPFRKDNTRSPLPQIVRRVSTQCSSWATTSSGHRLHWMPFWHISPLKCDACPRPSCSLSMGAEISQYAKSFTRISSRGMSFFYTQFRLDTVPRRAPLPSSEELVSAARKPLLKAYAEFDNKDIDDVDTAPSMDSSSVLRLAKEIIESHHFEFSFVIPFSLPILLSLQNMKGFLIRDPLSSNIYKVSLHNGCLECECGPLDCCCHIAAVRILQGADDSAAVTRTSWNLAPLRRQSRFALRGKVGSKVVDFALNLLRYHTKTATKSPLYTKAPPPRLSRHLGEALRVWTWRTYGYVSLLTNFAPIFTGFSPLNNLLQFESMSPLAHSQGDSPSPIQTSSWAVIITVRHSYLGEPALRVSYEIGCLRLIRFGKRCPAVSALSRQFSTSVTNK